MHEEPDTFCPPVTYVLAALSSIASQWQALPLSELLAVVAAAAEQIARSLTSCRWENLVRDGLIIGLVGAKNFNKSSYRWLS